jgi:adenylate kinase
MEMKRDRVTWIKGPAFQCNDLPAQSDRPWRLVLLGAPGIGKGTQSEFLRDRLGACHLSTGDVFRAAKCVDESERSPAMAAALDYMRRGELVPDETVLNMVRERTDCLRCRGGFLLDGFPRTVAQAEALQQILKEQNLQLDGVLSYELPIDEIVSRLSGRRTCGTCKAVFHVTALPPKKAGVCDHCGSALIQREDDRPEAVRVRMEAYEKSTAPLENYYRKLGLLVPISAKGSPDEIYQRTIDTLNARRGNDGSRQ